MTTEECIDHCNELLRGELAAVETYTQAQEKFSNNPAASVTLASLRDVHLHHVATLRQHVVEMNGKPAPGSGAWGAFARAVEGAAKAFGEAAAIQALIQGEKFGVNQYLDAIESDDVMANIKIIMEDELIPALRRNISTLEAMQS